MSPIEKAAIEDAPEIAAMINRFASREIVLPRSLNDVYENLRDFFVWREDGEILACAALHITWRGLGEVRSLVVGEERQGTGVGTALVESCLAEARELGMVRVFVLTYVPEFFERFGFVRVAKEELPHKIWADCLNCPKFPHCDEVALVLDLDREPTQE